MNSSTRVTLNLGKPNGFKKEGRPMDACWITTLIAVGFGYIWKRGYFKSPPNHILLPIDLESESSDSEVESSQ